MAPKRASQAEKECGGGGKKSRNSNGDHALEGTRPKVSEGITERQLASFSEVSAEANSGRLLQARKSLATSSKGSHAGFDSLLAAAGAQVAVAQQHSHVLGDYKAAAFQLLHLQQAGSIGPGFSPGFPPHPLGAAPPPGIPMPIGTVHDMTNAGALGAGGPGFNMDDASATQLRAMLQSRAFAANPVQALLTAQMAGQNSGSVLSIPQYALQPGAGTLPSMVTIDSHGKSPFSAPHQDFPFVAVNAVSVDTPDQHSVGMGAGSAAASRSDTKVEGSSTRSHGPSADRYKNRWSEDEIMALKKGVTRFEKKNKKRVEESSGSEKARGLDGAKKGETEQMWEHILGTHKFQPCRTARDLKDKWRQLKKKEQDDLLGVREEARRLRMLAVGPGGGSISSGSQGNTNSGDNGSSTSSSNGHGSADQAGNPSDDSPAGSSSPSAGMSSSCSGSTSSPAPTAQPGERSHKSRAADKAAAGDMSTSPSPANSSMPARGAFASKQQSNGNGSENGSDNNSEGSATGAVGSESGGAEGGSEGSEPGSDERNVNGGSEHGEGSEGSGEGGRGQGSDGSGDTVGDSIGNGTDETGQTSMGHSSHSAGTSSHEGRSDSSHEGGSDGRGGEEGASDGSSEWREDDDNGSDEKDRKRKHGSSHHQQQQQQSSSRSRLPRSSASIMEGIDSTHSWALAVDLGTNCVRVSLVNKHGTLLPGVEGLRSISMKVDASANTFSALEYMNAASQAIDDALKALRNWNNNQNKTCRHSSAGRSQGGSVGESGCGCGKCKPPILVRVVGISCFAMSLVGVNEHGDAVTPVYTYADGRNQAYAGELRRKLAEDGSLDFVERRTAPLQACYAPALFARLHQAGDWGNGDVKRWSSLSGYFLSKLTGTQQPMTFSEASCTGLMDREEMQWHQGLLNLLGIHLMTLPSLCDADELYMGGISADLCKRWPELKKTPWARGISEAAAFHIGTGCDVDSRRRVCVHMGTSAAIRLCVPCKDRRYRGGKTSGNGHKGSAHSSESSRKSAAKMGGEIEIQVPSGLFQYSIKRDLMLVGGTLADGGSIYAWGTEQLAGGLEEMARLQAEASVMEADSHGLTVLPFFSGSGSSSSSGSGGGLMPTTGTLTGMTLRTSRAHILRAIMESVALRLKAVFTSIVSVLPDDSFEVYASGDALFKSPLWQQILVDSLGVKIHFMSGEKYAAGKGAAVMALRAAGQEASGQQKPEHVVTPKAAGMSAMAMAFQRQEALYNRMNRH